MGYNVKASPAISFKLKSAYVKIIAPFDEYFNRIKQSPAKQSNNLSQRDRSPADSLSPLTSSLTDQDEANRVAGLKEVKPDEDTMASESARLATNPEGAPTLQALLGKYSDNNTSQFFSWTLIQPQYCYHAK
jgi:hypothetical protein